jgi:hypothetical protein
MNTIIRKIFQLSKKLSYFALQYVHVCLQWLWSLARSQLLQRWHRRLAQREVQKTYAGLGAEVYKAHRLGQENDWANLPDVKQQLKRVQEAESRVFQVDASAEQIHNDFSARKAELQAYYAGKRQEATAQAAEPSSQTASPDADVS